MAGGDREMNTKAPASLMFCESRPDSEVERLRECLRILGPAIDEDGFELRRGLAGVICLRAMRPFEGQNLLVNPEDGDLTDEERHRMVETMTIALGNDDFQPIVSYAFETGKINIDLLPRKFPGPPWVRGEIRGLSATQEMLDSYVYCVGCRSGLQNAELARSVSWVYATAPDGNPRWICPTCRDRSKGSES